MPPQSHASGINTSVTADAHVSGMMSPSAGSGTSSPRLATAPLSRARHRGQSLRFCAEFQSRAQTIRAPLSPDLGTTPHFYAHGARSALLRRPCHLQIRRASTLPSPTRPRRRGMVGPRRVRIASGLRDPPRSTRRRHCSRSAAAGSALLNLYPIPKKSARTPENENSQKKVPSQSSKGESSRASAVFKPY